ncbi:MAG: hydrolase [Deltaproteobacteria bacterium]|nr:hydrolase [Deltaproteobacteria bacterium]
MLHKPAQSLLTPDNCAVMLVDHQPQMFFGVQSQDRQAIINNVVGLAKAAKIFKVPVIISTIAAKTFSGPLLKQLQEVFPQEPVIDRTNMNAWEDERVVAAVTKTGRKKLAMAGLWTEVCLAYPAISARDAGYDVYAVIDASGSTSALVEQMALIRMTQAGVIPLNWLTVLLEFQRDWARQETYQAVLDVVREHAGAYGQGVEYVYAMFGAH